MTSNEVQSSIVDTFSDEELTALALAADPSVPIATDAVPWLGCHAERSSALPDWYMPSSIAVRHGRGTRLVVIAIIAGLVIIDAFGLCITSGFLTFA